MNDIEPNKKVIYLLDKNQPKWLKKKLWKDCTNKEKKEANLMEIPTKEVLLDYESEKEFKRGLKEVKEEYPFYEIWDTHSKEHVGGKHIILNFSNLFQNDIKIRNEIRRLIIKKFKADESKHSEKTFIPIPNKPHYKSGEIYSLVEKIEGINELDLNLIKRAKEILAKNLEIQNYVNPDKNFKEFFEKDFLWKELNKIDWDEMPNSCNFNNTISKNIAIASAKTGLSKEQVDKIVRPFIDKIKGYSYGSFEGWLRKAMSGELEDYNYYELNNWGKQFIRKEFYQVIKNLDDNVSKATKKFQKRQSLIAEEFYKIQPIYYDKAKIFWLWDFQNYKWARVDDTDILIKIEKGFDYDTINTIKKIEILEALRQVGRKYTPKEPKKTWIQFKDKIVDIDTEEEFEATSEYFMLNPIPWNLGSSEETPNIDRLFREWIIKEKIQDESWVDTLYEIVSFCLLSYMPLHRIICLIGSGLNGKGTFIRLLEKFLGRDNTTSTNLDIITKSNFETSKLYGKLACFIGEIDRGIFSKTAILKGITGDDLMRIEFKHKDGFDTHLYATPISACNTLPETTDKTAGFFRRWCIIDFPNRFSEKKDVLNEIPDREFENLSKKSLRYLKQLLKRGEFTNEGSIKDREKRYEERSNPIDRFIEEFCEKKNNLQISSQEFYDRYNEFLKANGLRLQSQIEVGRYMKERGFDKKVVSAKSQGLNLSTTQMVFLGLKWRDE